MKFIGADFLKTNYDEIIPVGLTLSKNVMPDSSEFKNKEEFLKWNIK